MRHLQYTEVPCAEYQRCLVAASASEGGKTPVGRDQTTQIGPRCAISELKERRKPARPSPTNAAAQDAAPAVRVARQAWSLCARRAPPPEKAAARLPTTKQSRALGKHAQRHLISRAGRACAPVAARGAFRFEHKRQREAGAFTFTQRARKTPNLPQTGSVPPLLLTRILEIRNPKRDDKTQRCCSCLRAPAGLFGARF